ncbi:uncharacterized protein LOC127841913 [Dreissena polymorpha]|uniref:Uncharacterized protein n=1 Tax=Dreissena polymorpha TaxID=45954 RepID=A0A9D4EW36_DREPO|nr:uncharacterized protein LOC127841913 [Dreissena polymorpha]KAH3787705.1 hypothetical protein DPMN_165832 [Dreissena polymorpha]
MIRILSLYCMCVVSGAMLFGGPCDLSPVYESGIPHDPNWSSKISVPRSCTNGTFRWDYPRGHVALLFENFGRATAACFRDSLGGEAFSITDVTSGHHMTQLPRLVRGSDKIVCTAASHGQPLNIRVDAPEDIVYMGEFAYFLQFS